MTVGDIFNEAQRLGVGGGVWGRCYVQGGWTSVYLPDALAESYRGLWPAIQLLNSWASLGSQRPGTVAEAEESGLRGSICQL